jgi:hypothetical protein
MQFLEKIKRRLAYVIEGPYHQDKTMLEMGNFKSVASDLDVDLNVVINLLKELDRMCIIRIIKPLSPMLSNDDVVVETFREVPETWCRS